MPRRSRFVLGRVNLLADGFSMAVSNALGSRAKRQEPERARRDEQRQNCLVPEGRARGNPADSPDPTRHRRRWRSTNLLERSLGEVKRRTKVIGRFPGETSGLTLVWAVLDLYIGHATNGIRFTQLERQHLKRLSYEEHDEPIPEEVTAA
jgi:hypothetical protein